MQKLIWSDIYWVLLYVTYAAVEKVRMKDTVIFGPIQVRPMQVCPIKFAKMYKFA